MMKGAAICTCGHRQADHDHRAHACSDVFCSCQSFRLHGQAEVRKVRVRQQAREWNTTFLHGFAAAAADVAQVNPKMARALCTKYGIYLNDLNKRGVNVLDVSALAATGLPDVPPFESAASRRDGGGGLDRDLPKSKPSRRKPQSRRLVGRP